MQFTVDRLTENAAAHAMARSLGALQTGQEGAMLECEIDIDAAIRSLREETDLSGKQPIFAHFAHSGTSAVEFRSERFLLQTRSQSR